MKKKKTGLPLRGPEAAGLKMKPKEKAAYVSAVRQMDEQCEKIGLLDPTGTEPAFLFSPLGGKK